MLKVTLLGEIGDRFVKSFDVEARSASEVIECLQSNFSNFTRYLMESHQNGVDFVIRAGYQELEEDELNWQLSKKITHFTITAVPSGSGGSLGKILLGVALIGAGFLTGGIGGIGFLGISSNTLLLTGGAMLLSGIASLFGGNKNDKSKDTKKSLLFSGGAQTATEGGRIPIVFGRHKTGLFVLSARIHSYQMT